MDDLIDDFIIETNEILEQLEGDLLRFKKHPDDKEVLNAIFRAMHTIKGTCSFLDFPELENAAHETEHVLMQCRDHKENIAPDDVKTIIQRIDHIKIIVGGIKKERSHHLSRQTKDSKDLNITQAWDQLPYLVDDLATKLNKKLKLNIQSQDMTIASDMLDAIKAPLIQIVRNATDHGIEPTAQRLALNKPETGVISIRAFHENDKTIITIEDDGKGLSQEVIRDKIIQNAWATEDNLAKMQKNDIQNFIFKPGFSTVPNVTDISGRGVGLDIARENIESIGGTIEVNSIDGKGTLFTITLNNTDKT